MWGGAGNLGMEEKTYRLDIAHGSGLDSPRVDPSTAVPYMATTSPKGSTLDNCAHGVVQGTRESDAVGAGVS
jgi:hypothetical protein